MSYIFKLNGIQISREKLNQLNLESEQMLELIETGSVECDGLTSDMSIDIVSIEHVTTLKKETLMLALFSTISALDEDCNGDIPKKYQNVGIQLGNKLLDMKLSYDDILDEMIILLGDSL